MMSHQKKISYRHTISSSEYINTHTRVEETFIRAILTGNQTAIQSMMDSQLGPEHRLLCTAKNFIENNICIFDLNLMRGILVHVAIAHKKMDVIHQLFKMDIPIESKNKHHHTPFYTAAIYKHYDAMQFFIQKHADINTTDQQGNTALHMAAATGNITLVNYLLEKGINIESKNHAHHTPLRTALSSCSQETFLLLLKKGANINASDQEGETLLHLAIRNHKQYLFNLLTGKGANVNSINQNGDTPLHIASSDRSQHGIHFVKGLLDHNANINVTNNEGNTPFYLSISSNAYDISRLLLKHASKAQLINMIDEKALIKASTAGRIGTLKLLLNIYQDLSSAVMDNVLASTINTFIAHCHHSENAATIIHFSKTIKFLILNGALANEYTFQKITTLDANVFYFSNTVAQQKIKLTNFQINLYQKIRGLPDFDTLKEKDIRNFLMVNSKLYQLQRQVQMALQEEIPLKATPLSVLSFALGPKKQVYKYIQGENIQYEKSISDVASILRSLPVELFDMIHEITQAHYLACFLNLHLDQNTTQAILNTLITVWKHKLSQFESICYKKSYQLDVSKQLSF